MQEGMDQLARGKAPSGSCLPKVVARDISTSSHVEGGPGGEI